MGTRTSRDHHNSTNTTQTPLYTETSPTFESHKRSDLPGEHTLCHGNVIFLISVAFSLTATGKPPGNREDTVSRRMAACVSIHSSITDGLNSNPLDDNPRRHIAGQQNVSCPQNSCLIYSKLCLVFHSGLGHFVAV